jgi:hypothetical protein
MRPHLRIIPVPLRVLRVHDIIAAARRRRCNEPGAVGVASGGVASAGEGPQLQLLLEAFTLPPFCAAVLEPHLQQTPKC